MEHDIAVYFRDQLRAARANAQRHVESFHEILYSLEKLGGLLSANPFADSLSEYRPALQELAARSGLAEELPAAHRDWHVPFVELYEAVRVARNDALHEGAFARHLTTNAIQLSLILEDALMTSFSTVSDYMVRNPVCAYLWQPISFVRQQMLLNSFSHLPILLGSARQPTWHLISDSALVQFLRMGQRRKEQLMITVEQAVASKALRLQRAQTCFPHTAVDDVVALANDGPLLVVQHDRGDQLLGIVTSYDLL